MDQTNIPFLDLATPHIELEGQLVASFRSALRKASFVGGPAVENFERDFASFCEAKYCVGVGSGTDALRFALIAAGVRRGDSVITVPHTFIATTEAISQAGAVPEFVDINEQTYTLDPANLREFLATHCRMDAVSGKPVSRRTGCPVTAVVPVHLYGQMADTDAILEIAEKYKLSVIEDACQAHGAEYFSQKQQSWKRAGSIGKAAAFSFYPGKNLGACGEAGAITTNDVAVAQTCRRLRDHGQAKKYYHDLEGYNGRLDTVQAAILHVKLEHLAKWNEQRRRHAAKYNQLFSLTLGNVILPHEPSWSRAVYHLYVIRCEHREQIIAHLNAAGIGTGIHYPIPLHLQKAYESLNYRAGDFPVTERIADQIVSLPMFPQLTAEQQERIVAEVARFLKARPMLEQVA